MHGGSRNLTALSVTQRIALVSANFDVNRLTSDDAVKMSDR